MSHFAGDGEIRIQASIQGDGNVIKDGTGLLAYEGNFSGSASYRYTGRTEVLRGTLLLQNVIPEGALPSMPGPLVIGANTPSIGKESSAVVRAGAYGQISPGIPLTLRPGPES